MSEKIDISGLDKRKILRALWENSKPASFYDFLPHLIPKFDENVVESSIEYGYIDYFCGRLIKTDFSGDTLRPDNYDHTYGDGKMKEIIENLRKSKN